jgi:hypothetical protein
MSDFVISLARADTPQGKGYAWFAMTKQAREPAADMPL